LGDAKLRFHLDIARTVRSSRQASQDGAIELSAV
jgi:hypothetical protein